MINQVENFAKSMMDGKLAHDFKHVDRVRCWILAIAKKEGYRDLKVAEVAALLHDIGRAKAKTYKGHGKVGANMAGKYLEKNNIFSKGKINEIRHAIRHHNSNKKVSGELAHILRDADMLDMFGAVGIMRAFVSCHSKPEYDEGNIKGETWGMTRKAFDNRFDGETGIGKFVIDHINFQISCFDNLNTKTAEKLARPLIKYMKNYILQMEKEILKKI